MFSQSGNGKIFLKNGIEKEGYITFKMNKYSGGNGEIVNKRIKKIIYNSNKKGEEKIEYTFLQIEKIVFLKGNTYYIKKTGTGNKLIAVQLIKEGFVSIFSNLTYNPSGYLDRVYVAGGAITSHYLQKENEKLTKIFPVGFLKNDMDKTMIRYFSDCPKLIKFIAGKTFKKYVDHNPKFKNEPKLTSRIIEIVKYYNSNCQEKK
jgi:hypothetical protein